MPCITLFVPPPPLLLLPPIQVGVLASRLEQSEAPAASLVPLPHPPLSPSAVCRWLSWRLVSSSLRLRPHVSPATTASCWHASWTVMARCVGSPATEAILYLLTLRAALPHLKPASPLGSAQRDLLWVHRLGGISCSSYTANNWPSFSHPHMCDHRLPH